MSMEIRQKLAMRDRYAMREARRSAGILEISDIVGAGDSCSAGITCAMVSGATHEQAAAFGNLVASITIQQIGTTGTASPEQVRQRWGEGA